jgi:hypothetical protein
MAKGGEFLGREGDGRRWVTVFGKRRRRGRAPVGFFPPEDGTGGEPAALGIAV